MPYTEDMNCSSQRGNVLFYILLAIALLAGLTFAVQQGSRSSATALTADQARIAASSIIDYANTVSASVSKLKLRGCTETQISFANSLTGATYTNPSAPTDKSCHVFDVVGAQINWTDAGTFSAGAVELTGGCNVASVGTTASELLLVVEDIDVQTCTFINEKLGVPMSSGAPITLPAACTYAPFVGAYPAAGTVTVTGTLGRMAACVKGTGASDDFFQNTYHFYQVLLAR